MTLPGRARHGGLHPVSRTMERIEAIFGAMGFDVADGRRSRPDWMSFTALNNPENHPARSMQDTFYVDLGRRGAQLNLRPHTVADAGALRPGQRASTPAAPMPEIRVIAPGRTYRVDSDATHSPMFHQCEGLWIGENVSFKDLKVVFTDFLPPLLRVRRPAPALPAVVLPVHRAERRDRHRVRDGPLQGRWLEVGLRPGAPERGAQLRPRPRALHRVRVRHGAGPIGDAALWRERPAPVLRRRPALPRAVRPIPPPNRFRRTPANSPSPGCASSATRRSTAGAGRVADHVRHGGRVEHCAVAPPFTRSSSSPGSFRPQRHRRSPARVARWTPAPNADLLQHRLQARVGADRHPVPCAGRRRTSASDDGQNRFRIKPRQAARRRKRGHAVLGARTRSSPTTTPGCSNSTRRAPVGRTSSATSTGLDDTVFTLKLTPTWRTACRHGIAREVSALTGAPLKHAGLRAARGDADQCLPVRIGPRPVPDASGRVVRRRPRAKTPAWMVERLERCGIAA